MKRKQLELRRENLEAAEQKVIGVQGSLASGCQVP